MSRFTRFLFQCISYRTDGATSTPRESRDLRMRQ
jgi:hypothetical protein